VSDHLPNSFRRTAARLSPCRRIKARHFSKPRSDQRLTYHLSRRPLASRARRSVRCGMSSRYRSPWSARSGHYRGLARQYLKTREARHIHTPMANGRRFEDPLSADFRCGQITAQNEWFSCDCGNSRNVRHHLVHPRSVLFTCARVRRDRSFFPHVTLRPRRWPTRTKLRSSPSR
jgi:hypothetical protein